MQFLSLLGAMADVIVLPTGYQIGLDWLGHFARIIIEGVGITGLGIVVFNLVLKAITLPFDIYQRVMSRKQNLIMKQMQPELEKLQKQYANDSKAYSEKMLELQKKNGYSMLGACLPMIVSLVILIVAWQGFRAYSQYANLNNFVHMSESYNAAVLESGVDGIDFRYLSEEGEFLVYTDENGEEKRLPITWEDGKEVDFEGDVSYILTDMQVGGETAKYLTVMSKNADNYIFYYYNLTTNAVAREYKIDLARFAARIGKETAVEEDSEAHKTALQQAKDAAAAFTEGDAASEQALSEAASLYLKTIGSEAAAVRFREEDPSFLWIKNVWYPDVSYNHPIPPYDTFQSQFRNEKVVTAEGKEENVTSLLTSEKYEALTYSLGAEKDAPNGYFILIVLSIGFMLLSQIVAMKSNKTANQYQTVDGQGASTQKVMLVVMPLIYAFFSFSYSAAFSIYMTMSSVVVIIVTLLTNLILGRIFKKKEEKAFVEEHTRKLPWMK